MKTLLLFQMDARMRLSRYAPYRTFVSSIEQPYHRSWPRVPESNEALMHPSTQWVRLDEDVVRIFGVSLSKMLETRLKMVPGLSFTQDVCFAERIRVRKSVNRIVVVGDLHSGLVAFFSILDLWLERQWVSIDTDEQLVVAQDTVIVFTGDIVDRGPWSIELLLIIIHLQFRNPGRVFVCNGNHEDASTYRRYGLTRELELQTNDTAFRGMIEQYLHTLPTVMFFSWRDHLFQMCHGLVSNDRELWSRIKTFLASSKDMWIMERGGCDSSTFKWGDVTLRPTSGVQKGRGEYLAPGDIRAYLESTSIQCVFRGHQDFIPFGIIPRSDSAPLPGWKPAADYTMMVPKHYALASVPLEDVAVVTVSAATPTRIAGPIISFACIA